MPIFKVEYKIYSLSCYYFMLAVSYNKILDKVYTKQYSSPIKAVL